MKFALKSIVAAAAFVAAGAASAATGLTWEFVSGTGGLTFSQDALDALDASGAYILTDGVDNKAHYDGIATVSLDFTAGTAVGDDIKTLTSTGSSVVIERTVVQKGKTTLDRTITLSNFVFDLGTKTLSANVAGTNLLTGVTTDYGFSAVYSAASLAGGTISVTGPAVGGYVPGSAAGQTTGAFSINTATADNFLTILGLPLTGGVADLVKNSDWGVATADGVVRAAVPEPSAYLSFLAGIAVLGAVRARKQKAA